MPAKRNDVSTPIAVRFLGQNPISLNYLTRLLRGHGFVVLDESTASEQEAAFAPGSLFLVLDEALLTPGSRVTMQSLRTRFPGAKVLMLATAMPSAQDWQLLRGIDGLVLYSEAKERLAPALRALHDEHMWLPQEMLECFARLGIHAGKLNRPLTGRETEIFQLMREGLCNKEIADKLRITEKTAKFHASNIYAKLGAHDRLSAVELGRSVHGSRKQGPSPM